MPPTTASAIDATPRRPMTEVMMRFMAQWTCSICGESHEGIPLSWGFDAPFQWSDSADEDENAHRDSDICWYVDEDGERANFVRGTIEIPIVEPRPPDEETFMIGVWVSLSQSNFDWLLEHWQAGPDEQRDPPWFGWLSNEIPIYPDSVGLKTNVYLRGEELRPSIEVQPGEHPLARDQHEGISLERARQLGERWLHL